MKIEICEHAVSSYLKHIEECKIVQTNWRRSSKWYISDDSKRKADDLIKTLKKSDLFKKAIKTKNFDKLIKETEVDVLGVNLEEDKIFGVEVAFHSNGLQYGGKVENTTNRIIKKVLRLLFTMNCYFENFSQYNIYFVVPKVEEKRANKIKQDLEELRKIIDNEAINIEFIANEDFYTKILNPVLSINQYDGNDLFSRAATLLKLGEKLDKGDDFNSYSQAEPYVEEFENEDENDPLVEEIKQEKYCIKEIRGIGKLVQEAFKDLDRKGKLSADEILKLSDKNYSKKVFNQDLSVLRPLTEGRIDDRGYNRYYKDIYLKEFYLNSQWYERHRKLFIDWYEKVKN